MKKVLAWAVALALVLSSFTMAFAADTKTSADFKDASSINYTEAVDVMVATGIINGYPDGTFGPAKTVKRAEMAKMIAVMMNGGEDIGDTYKGSCPFKDSQNHWAAGYIAYCAAEHIIDGRSADVFDPEAEVTGTEVAKMALTALGYDSKIQGYVGENWAANVLKDAKKNDLFDGMDNFVPADPCNRESAAQILFNALQATEVEYENGTTVSIGDANVTVSSKIKEVEPSKKDQEKFGDTLELFEDIFGGDLEKTTKDADDFGRPAHEWAYEDESIDTYPDSADYEFIAEKDTSLNDAIKEFNEDLYDDIKDGEIKIAKTLYNGLENGSLHLGDKVELFETADDTYTAIVSQYVAYQIDEVDTDVSSKEAKDGITAKVTFSDELGQINDDKIVGYDASTYVEDAVIAVAVKNGKIIDSYAMKELASGEVTKTYSKAVAIDGTKYDASTAPKAFGKALAVENTYTLYDYNGYYLASVLEEESSDDMYGVLEVAGKDKDIFGNVSASVKMITTDGKEVIYEVDTDEIKDADLAALPAKDKDASDDVLVIYTLNDDGQVDSIKPATKTVGTETKGAEMKTNGILAGKTVAEDVVAFFNDGEVTDPEYVVYDFSDLEDAEEIFGTYVMNKDEDTIMALLLKKDLTASEDILGFVTDVEPYTTSDGPQADVTALVDGKEVTYTTVAKYDFEVVASEKLVKFELNKDGELSGVTDAKVAEATEIVEKIEGDAVKLAGTVNDKSNNSLNLGTDSDKNYQSVAGAYVYFINDEGDMEISSYAKIKKHNTVTLYQTDEDSSAWNIVVFQEVAASGDSTGE